MKKYFYLSMLSLGALLMTSCASKGYNQSDKTGQPVTPSALTPPTPSAQTYPQSDQEEYHRVSFEERLPKSAPQHIALLLPLHGPAGKQGQAIQNGFLATYYGAKQHGYSPTVTVLDTADANVAELYQQAVRGGAEVVVGPLLKQDVEALANTHLSVKTIALNTVSDAHRINNLYQFGLDPSDEVDQVAKRLQQEGRTRVLVIYPDNPFGERLRSSFQSSFNAAGGNVVSQIAYRSPAQFSEELRNALNLAASQKRYAQLNNTLRERLRFMPRRRQDFDAVFLACTPEQGRQIMPLLRFYYVNNVPFYATSQIYQGATHAAVDRDLDGVTFDDIPWLFSMARSDSTLLMQAQTQAKQTWPTSYQAFPRLYGLGADAFTLAAELSQWNTQQGFNLATGKLYLQDNGKIYRQLTWARIRNGIASPL